jgi:hypothetical protein
MQEIEEKAEEHDTLLPPGIRGDKPTEIPGMEMPELVRIDFFRKPRLFDQQQRTIAIGNTFYSRNTSEEIGGMIYYFLSSDHAGKEIMDWC